MELYNNFPGEEFSPSITNLARDIDAIANKGEVCQQAALCIAERCWVLVNSYSEWRRKHEKLLLRPSSEKILSQEKRKNWVRKIKLQAEIELAYETLATLVPLCLIFSNTNSRITSDLTDVITSFGKSTQFSPAHKFLRDAWELVSTDRIYVRVASRSAQSFLIPKRFSHSALFGGTSNKTLRSTEL